MSGPLAGRTVLVTGASSGIGRALALAVVERGAQVIAVARSAEKLAALAAVTGPSLMPVTADVTSDESVHALVTALPSPGTVDVVVNNAAVGYLEPFSSSGAQHWRETMETNLMGALRVIRAFLPAMVARGSGLIVNVGSNGATGWPFLSLYAASKAALDAATAAIGHECLGTGVGVISVRIGPTRGTEFGSRFTDPEVLTSAMEAWTRLGIPWDQFVTPDVSAGRILEAIEAHAECYR